MCEDEAKGDIPFLRSSRRNRHKSNNRKPDFVYFDEDSFLSEEIRPRTSSWSSSGGVAVVEWAKKKRALRSQSQTRTVVKSDSRTDLALKGKNKVKTDLSKEDYESVNNLKWNQPKINTHFTKTENAIDTSDDEVQFNATIRSTAEQTTFANLQANSNTSVSDSVNASITDNSCTNSNSSNKYLQGYGSDFDSFVNTEPIVVSKSTNNQVSGDQQGREIETISTGTTQLVSNKSYTEQGENNTENTMSHITEESLTKMFGKLKTEMKENNEEMMKRVMEEGVKTIKQDLVSLGTFKTEVSQDVTQLKQDVDALRGELATTKVQLKMYEVRLNEVAGCSIRQEQRIEECQSKLEDVSDKIDSNLLRIRGIIEQKGENCMTKINTFFKEVLEIEQTIKVRKAHRIGKGKNRPILVHLKDSRDKGLVFANTEKLKDATNQHNKPYSVSNQMSARKHATRLRHRQIKKQNEQLGGEKLDITAEHGELRIEGKLYEKAVKPPPLRDLLWPSNDKRKKLLNVNPTKGSPVEVGGQSFIGYTCPARTVAEINDAYAKLRSIYMQARHIICGYALPHRSFHTHQDFYDDDEHNGGAFLLQLLHDSNITNRAIFVVRLYDGEHIGSKRFDAMREAVSSALAQAGKNPITGNYDILWDSSKENHQGHGQGSIRGKPRTLQGHPQQQVWNYEKPAWMQKDPLDRIGNSDINTNTTAIEATEQQEQHD